MSSAESLPWEWILARYDALDADALRSARRVAGGFSGAAVWRVERSGQVAPGVKSVAARRWPPGVISAARLDGLHRLLHHIAREGVACVAPPIRTRAGSTFCSDGDSFWQIEPWLPGIADFHDSPTPARRRAAMTALARWHLAAARFVPCESEREWFFQATAAPSPAVAQRRRLIEDWLTRRAADFDRILSGPAPSSTQRPSYELETLQVARRVWNDFPPTAPTVLRELATWESRRPRVQPCVRDLWHDHVLFTDDRVTGLIDPSAARTDSIAVDLARLLGSLLGDDFAAWNDALDDYARVAPLSDEERGLARALDRAGTLLNPLTWLERHFLRGQPIDSAAKLDRLRGHAERLRRLRDEIKN